MYVMGTLLRHGSESKGTLLAVSCRRNTTTASVRGHGARGGTDTTRIETVATRDSEGYVITGRKMFISRVQHSDLMVLLARTSPRDYSRPPVLVSS